MEHSIRVAPSRWRGSKQPGAQVAVPPFESPPHGGVDRNTGGPAHPVCGTASPPHGGVDRNAFLCAKTVTTDVAPSRGRGSKRIGARCVAWTMLSPPHGGVDRNYIPRPVPRPYRVAPSRGRGSKQPFVGTLSRTFGSPPHGGVDRNFWRRGHGPGAPGRPLTGAWIETDGTLDIICRVDVAPSRGRGSKLYDVRAFKRTNASPPHGGVDRNPWPAGQ